MLAAVFHALFFGVEVPSEGRDPDSERRAQPACGLLQRGEPVRKAAVELPESAVVIPSVIHEEAVQAHRAFGDQFAA